MPATAISGFARGARFLIVRVMKIGIVLPNWIGDVVMATPALRAVRERFPEAQLTGIMRPYVHEVLAGTRGSTKALRSIRNVARAG